MPKIGPNLASKATTTHATSPPPSAAPATPSPTPTAADTTNTSSLPPITNEPAWLTGIALKASHEHSFATQRAKKAADRAKGKAPPRKALSSSSSTNTGVYSSSSSGGAAPARTAEMTSIWAEIWDARKTFVTGDDLDWPELPTTTTAPLQQQQQRWSTTTEYALRPTQNCEVPLSALVRPVKLRGAKAKGASPQLMFFFLWTWSDAFTTETEFEFLPPVRNVIALDDADSNVPDEPWEYISSVGGDDEARKIFSYAEIVSKSA
jgi:hypothetical protein